MADQDRYSNQDQNRDRLGQRDVYMDNRTGVGAPGRGYRAQWGGGRDRDYGDREQNYNMRRGENASFREQDYGQQDGGRTGYRSRDDDSRYGGGYGGSASGSGASSQNAATGGMAGGYYGESGTYGQGGRWSRNESYEARQGGTGRGREGAREGGRDWMSYPARSNPDFYADENGSAGPGWTEEYGGGRDRSLESYRGQNRDQNRWSGGEGGYGGGYRSPGSTGQTSFRTYEADATFHDRDFRDRDFTHEYRDDRGRGGFWDRAADKVASWFGGDDSRGSPYDTGVSHRGRGPKGYRRSDERIREDVSDRLTDDHWLDASDIEVKVEGCEVILSGSVKDRDAKRRAEQLAEQVSGVDNVQNHLRVEKAQDWRSDTSTGSTATGTTGGSTTGATAAGATTSNMGDLGTPASTTGSTAGETTTTGRSGKTTQ